MGSNLKPSSQKLLLLAVMAKNEICEIRNVPIFLEQVEIFQNWHIGDKKLIGVIDTFSQKCEE